MLSDFPGIKNLSGLNDLNSLNNLSGLNDLNDLYSLISSKNLYFKVKMYIFDSLSLFITWKRPLKVILKQFTLLFQSDLLIIRKKSGNIKKIKIDDLGINVPLL
jgi:hypothetical protein